ncbi:MAG TPA: nuclear transport factor 2 family protein, partial [Vicinamibacterales bacterium]|nr:nuclear transport factor 2 family protein [Vicinamibacterales bacterium]
DARMGGCYGLRSMPMAPAEWLAAYRTAWLQRDADAAAALFTEDATYGEQPYQDAFAGPAAVREYWARVTAAQSNIEMRYGTPITVGNRTAVEWWTTLVNDGAPITLAGAFILTFDASGRCRSLREYWQFTDGTHEPKPGWGS